MTARSNLLFSKALKGALRYLKLLSTPVISAVLASAAVYLLTLFMAEDPVWVSFVCNPTHPVVGQVVSCRNLSVNTEKFRWEFGDGSAKETLHAEKVYNNVGYYEIKLIAFPSGRDTAIFSAQQIEVVDSTKSTEQSLVQPLVLTIYGRLKDEALYLRKEVPVNEIKDDHPSIFRSDSRRYTVTANADENFRIIEAAFQEQGRSNADDIKTEILKDGQTATLSFKLTSGSMTQRWRGWLHGVLLLRQKRTTAAQEVVLADGVSIDRKGLFRLEKGYDLSELKGLFVKDDLGAVVGIGEVGKPIRLRDSSLSIVVSDQSGFLIIDVAEYPQQQ